MSPMACHATVVSMFLTLLHHRVKDLMLIWKKTKGNCHTSPF